MLISSLDSLHSEIHSKLQDQGFAVFYSLGRLMDKLTIVHWDWESHPSIDGYLQVAKQLDIKVMQMHDRTLTPEVLEDAELQLNQASLPANDVRDLSKRLQQVKRHIGERCLMELSFDYRDRVYLFTVETDWYADLNDMLDVLLYSSPDLNDDEPRGGSVGGFFSKN
jgi:hypothetical protein